MTFESETILRLEPGVWMRNAVDNCLWADLGDGVLVVDALEDVSMAAIVQEDVMATAGKPLRWVVNTHGDPDHVACNAAWTLAGATVIAHEAIGTAMAGRPGCPSVLFADRYTLEGSREEAHFRWLGGAHSPSDTVIHFPWAQVLHIGDLFGWGLIPIPVLTDARAARLVEVLNIILEYDAETVVCGHGPTLTPAHIRRFLAYFDELRVTIASLAAQGLSAAEIEGRCPPPEDMRDWWRFVDWKHRQNIAILLGEKGARE